MILVNSFVSHPQNGDELRLVLEVDVMRGEPVMRVVQPNSRSTPSHWITQKGWSTLGWRVKE